MSRKETIIRVVCQFCGKHYKDIPGEGVTGTSHGVCLECAAAPQCNDSGFPVYYCQQRKACPEHGERKGKKRNGGIIFVLARTCVFVFIMTLIFAFVGFGVESFLFLPLSWDFCISRGNP